MKHLAFLSTGLALASTATAQSVPPGESPALGYDRITQAEVESGTLSHFELRMAGLRMFATPFNKYDGHGDGVFDVLDPDHTTPEHGNRPYLQNNGTFLRINGLDAQTCQECHGIVSNGVVPARLGIGGVAGIANTAMPIPTEIDVDDEAGNGFAFYNGRLINPPFLFGAGGVELVGKEMTRDLQDLKALAEANPDTDVALVTKGVSFGTIRFDSGTNDFDTSAVEGIDEDLVVRPFGRKGEFTSTRQFDIGALMFHFGMQPVEAVGLGVDADDDGVVNEIMPGELSAMHIFATSNERPRQVGAQRPAARRGRIRFEEAGCVMCHVPEQRTGTRFLPLGFPEVLSDPWANVYYQIDLSQDPPKFRRAGAGVEVELFSDLKRHDMGPALAESVGSPLDAQFITPRLWGVADTAPYLHDGRALTLSEAILMHGGEGQFAADNFAAMPDQAREDLLAFLRTLRTPIDPSQDIAEALQALTAGPDGGYFAPEDAPVGSVKASF
jgi:hypothetical protein